MLQSRAMQTSSPPLSKRDLWVKIELRMSTIPILFRKSGAIIGPHPSMHPVATVNKLYPASDLPHDAPRVLFHVENVPITPDEIGQGYGTELHITEVPALPFVQ